MDLLRPLLHMLGQDAPNPSADPPGPLPFPPAGTSAPGETASPVPDSAPPVSSEFRCPERGEEFEIYARTLERDFRGYDPSFRLERWLGSGGFCDVFLVPEVVIPGKGRRRAVLRVLRPTIYRTPDPVVNNSVIRLFLTEIGYNLFLTNLNASHVVKMFDFGFFGRGPGVVDGRARSSEARHFYMLMEYVDGEDIAVRWARRPADEKNFLKRVIQLVQIAGILGELHFRGIVHCDLKPTNILLRGNDAFLTDFGSARWMNAQDEVGDMHMHIPGTQTYMSPEQLRGQYWKLDQRSDIFSLAVLSVWALTGQNPFEGRASIDLDESRGGLAALADLSPEIPRIPYRGGDRLVAFLLECLDDDPQRRPLTMVVFQQRLNRWILEN